MSGHTYDLPNHIRINNEFKSAFALMLENPLNGFWRNRAYRLFLAICKR